MRRRWQWPGSGTGCAVRSAGIPSTACCIRHCAGLVVQALFDHQSPGYRDWRQFANHAVFLDSLNAYLYPAGAQTFGGTRFNFAAWALAHIPDDANPAWEEQIMP